MSSRTHIYRHHFGREKMGYKNDCKTILEFWLKNSLDTENGGIFTCLDREGHVYGTDKSVWFQGRALWVYAKAYNLVEKNPAYLAAADTIYRFLPKCVDMDGRMFFTVTADGRELQKRRYYFSETFAAIGCAEYYKATGKPEALEKAERFFDTAFGCFTGKIPCTSKISSASRDLKALSPVMIMLSTAQVMRSIPGLYEKYDAICRACLAEIMEGGYFTDKALMENVTRDGDFSDTPTGRIVNPGHAMECAWFVLAEGLLTNNAETLAFGKAIIDKTLPLGLDEKNGGIIAFTDVVGQPPVQLEWDMKLWWPQCETMIALRLAHLLFGEEKYREQFASLLSYTEKYFVDWEYGEWYGYLHYDNSVSTNLKGNIFKGPFHIPRFYMIMHVLEESGSLLPYLI